MQGIRDREQLWEIVNRACLKRYMLSMLHLWERGNSSAGSASIDRTVLGVQVTNQPGPGTAATCAYSPGCAHTVCPLCCSNTCSGSCKRTVWPCPSCSACLCAGAQSHVAASRPLSSLVLSNTSTLPGSLSWPSALVPSSTRGWQHLDEGVAGLRQNIPAASLQGAVVDSNKGASKGSKGKPKRRSKARAVQVHWKMVGLRGRPDVPLALHCTSCAEHQALVCQNPLPRLHAA